MRAVRPAAASLGVVLIALMAAQPAAAAGTRRLAVVIGHNTGGPERAPLRYAESDAGKVGRILTELGDVEPRDVFLIQGKGVEHVRAALARVEELVEEAHDSLDRVVLYFYYSGHGDQHALELGSERLTHAALRELLTETGADLRVAIVDACESGALLREKGARSVPAFRVSLVDELLTEGDAIITSSARDELSLESSELGGGFFTSHLLTGLRGAADVSGDGQVTLAELYEYAHERTVTTTTEAAGVAQHPSFELNLSGRGELVIARLAPSSARLVVPAGAERALVRDVVTDQLLAEWTGGGASELIAVPPGTYLVTLVSGGERLGGRLRLAAGERRELSLQELRPFPSRGPAISRGALAKPSSLTSLASPNERTEVTALASFGPGTGGLLRVGLEARSGHAFTVAVVGGFSQFDVWYGTRTGSANTWMLSARLGYRLLWGFGRLGVWAGAEAALGLALETALPVDPGWVSLDPLAGLGPRVGAFFEPTPNLRIGVQGEALLGIGSVGHLAVGLGVSWAH